MLLAKAGRPSLPAILFNPNPGGRVKAVPPNRRLAAAATRTRQNCRLVDRLDSPRAELGCT